MKILAIEKYISGASNEKFTDGLLKEEAIKAWEYYENGIFREIYFTKEENRAVIILECSTVTDAKALLEELPLVKSNLIEFEVYELTNYTGFIRLFG